MKREETLILFAITVADARSRWQGHEHAAEFTFTNLMLPMQRYGGNKSFFFLSGSPCCIQNKKNTEKDDDGHHYVQARLIAAAIARLG